MTLQQLRYVIQVVASGSITAAAARLYIAQPSLSKAIQELEQELGIVIFERSSRGVTLTDEGERFVVYAREVVDQADRLEGRYKDADGPRRAFFVSAPHASAIAATFAELIQADSEQRYEFCMRELSTEGIVDDVRAQRSEVGIAYRSRNNRDSFDTTIREAGLRFAPFASIRPQVLLAKGHPLARQTSVTPESLEMLPCVAHTPNGTLGQTIDDALVPLPQPARRVHTNDHDTLRALVAALGGYALLLEVSERPCVPSDLVARDLAVDTLVEAGLVSRPGYRLSPMAHDFVSRLTDFARLHQQKNQHDSQP